MSQVTLQFVLDGPFWMARNDAWICEKGLKRYVEIPPTVKKITVVADSEDHVDAFRMRKWTHPDFDSVTALRMEHYGPGWDCDFEEWALRQVDAGRPYFRVEYDQ